MSAKRATVLHLRLSEAAVRSTGAAVRQRRSARVENTRTPVTAETIREWCGRPDPTSSSNRSVTWPSTSRSRPTRSPTGSARPSPCATLLCLPLVHPTRPRWTRRTRRRLRPHPRPRPGRPDLLLPIAPLCRRHHRFKTHGGWRYHVLEPGSYVWTSPHGYQYLRDHTGTLDVSRDRHRCRPPTDDTPPRPPTGET